MFYVPQISPAPPGEALGKEEQHIVGRMWGEVDRSDPEQRLAECPPVLPNRGYAGSLGRLGSGPGMEPDRPARTGPAALSL